MASPWVIDDPVEFANPWHDEIGRFAPKGTGRTTFADLAAQLDDAWRDRPGDEFGPAMARIETAVGDGIVASAGEFANPWHDEIGRFAPKGTGRTFSLIADVAERYEIPADGQLEYQGGGDLNHQRAVIAKHYGSIAVAEQMTYEERGDLGRTLHRLTASDLGGEIRPEDVGWIIPEVESTAAMYVGEDAAADLPLGLAFQLHALHETGRSFKIPYASTEAISSAIDQYLAGDVEASDVSLTIESYTDISTASAAVHYVHKAWSSSATSAMMLGLHHTVARADPTIDIMNTMGRYLPSGAYATGERAMRGLHGMYSAVHSATYRHTQAVLDEIIPNVADFELLRGVKTGSFAEGDTVRPNPLSSWSTDPNTAVQFTGLDGRGSMLTAVVPRESIFAMAAINGFGSMSEREAVLYGHEYELVDVQGGRGG